MEQFELGKMIENTFAHTEQSEEINKAIYRQVYSDQKKITATIKKGDFEATIQQVETKNISTSIRIL